MSLILTSITGPPSSSPTKASTTSIIGLMKWLGILLGVSLAVQFIQVKCEFSDYLENLTNNPHKI